MKTIYLTLLPTVMLESILVNLESKIYFIIFNY